MPKKKKAAKNGRPNKPARVLLECSPHRITGGGRLEGLTEIDVEHESTPESGTLLTLALCHDVHSIRSQASEEPYEFEGRIRHHIPDFTVECFVSALRIEVKALASLVRADALDQYSAVGRGYRLRQVPFALLVDAQLQEAPRYASVKLLSRYVNSAVPPNVLRLATAALQSGPMAIPDLLSTASLQLLDVWVLIARRHLSFDWSQPLDRFTTVVGLTNRPFEGLKLAHILRSTRFAPLLEELALGRRPTDQRLLADAAAWRQRHIAAGPYQFVGGIKKSAPLRDLREEEYIPRNPRCRRDYAPGNRDVPIRNESV